MKQEQEYNFKFQDLVSVGMYLVILGIGIAVGLQVVGETQDEMTINSSEYNATGETISAIAKIPEKLGLIVTVILAVVILTLLLRYLVVRLK